MSYSERLLQQGNQLTRLAHRSRFSAVLDALDGTQYTQALDYGCGDGWLLRSAYEQGAIAAGFGVDIEDYMLAACQETCANIPHLKFCKPNQISEKVPPQSCDLVFCTETLEHIGNSEEILDLILQYCKPGARMVISVPLEIGPSLIFKQMGRYFANLKGKYGYERYQLNELLAAGILWDTNRFHSSHSKPDEFTGHKGFDYRKIEKLLTQKVTVEKIIFSPFPWLGNLLNSTVIWVCRV